MIYFFYNHMIDLKDVEDVNPSDFEYIGEATLKDYKMSFRVLPDIEPANGKSVTGLLFYVNSDMTHMLDNDMECPNLYTKRERFVTFNGTKILAQVYVQKFTKQLYRHPPPSNYLATLYKLYLESGLPLDQINDAIADLDRSQYSVNI